MKSGFMEKRRKGHKMKSTGGSFSKMQMGEERQERNPGGHTQSVRFPGWSWPFLGRIEFILGGVGAE